MPYKSAIYKRCVLLLEIHLNNYWCVIWIPWHSKIFFWNYHLHTVPETTTAWTPWLLLAVGKNSVCGNVWASWERTVTGIVSGSFTLRLLLKYFNTLNTTQMHYHSKRGSQLWYSIRKRTKHLSEYEKITTLSVDHFRSIFLWWQQQPSLSKCPSLRLTCRTYVL